jgi:AcrR family transcriptional regulator
MARRPEAEKHDKSDRDKIVDALMVLLTEKPIEEIGFGEIAARAGLTLAQCRGEFASLVAIIAAHMKELDRKVLAGGEADMAEEPPRERLFDVLMRRLEALGPRKEAVRSLLRSAGRSPGLAVVLNGVAVRSMQWMLAAADIGAAGTRGAIRAQGLALLYGRVLRTWVDDDDPGLARTMAMLDRQLARGARWAGFVEDLCRLAPGPWRWRERSRRRARHGNGGAGEDPVVA